MPSKPCKKPGCPNLIKTKDRYCAAHASRDSRRTKKTDKLYGSYRWKQVRALKRKLSPLCELCLSEGKTTLAQMVDHIVEVKDGGERFDIDNLQSLCSACHNEKTAKNKKVGRL